MREGNLLPLIIAVFLLFIIYMAAKNRHEKLKRKMKDHKRFGKR